MSLSTLYAYGQESDSSEKINGRTLGCLVPLSGQYELIGKRVLKGILAAAGVFGGDDSQIIVVSDYGKNPLEHRKALEEMVTKDGVSAVIGPILSSSIKEISQSVKTLEIPTVVFPLSEDTSQENPYFIRFSYSLEKQARILADYAVQDAQVKTLGILYPRTELGGLFKEAFISSIRESGGNITYIGSYDPKALDISGEIKWMKSRHPDAVFIPDGATHSASLITKLRRESDLKDLIFLGPNTWNSQAFIKAMGDGADKVVFTDFFFSGSERWMDFNLKFRADFGEEPGFLEYQVYEAATLIFQVLKTPVEKREDIKERILSLKDNTFFNITENSDGSLTISPKPLILTLRGEEIIRVK